MAAGRDEACWRRAEPVIASSLGAASVARQAGTSACSGAWHDRP